MTSPAELICPTCGARHAPEERFCSECGVPLVREGDGEAPRSEAHGRARKIDPEYAGGEPVRVAYAAHQAEAEMIQGLLLEEGIPSMVRRSGGFDVPDFLAAGPRDVLVPSGGAEAARDVLLEADLGGLAAGVAEPEEPARDGGATRRLSLAAAVLGGGFVAALVAWVLLEAAG